MTKPPIPDEIRRFILTSIPSVPYLEALLLLRSDGSQAWTTSGAARRLYVDEAHALALLQGLGAAGIAQQDIDGDWRYAPATDELRARLDALAATYAADLLGVTDMIHSRIDKRALQFADAFRWNKEGR